MHCSATLGSGSEEEAKGMQGRFIDGVVAKPHTVTVELVDHGIWIVSMDGQIRQFWPLTDTELLDKNVGKIRLSCQGRGDARLIVSSEEFDIYLVDGTDKPQSASRGLPKLVTGLITVAVLLVIGGFFAIPRLADGIAALIPYSVEHEWGLGVARQFDQLGDYCVAPEGKAALAKMENALSAHPLAQYYPIRLQVLDAPIVNAFALPGGHIRLLEGLIDEAESQEEILGILAHEVGHVVHRHALSRMVELAGVQLVVQVLGGGSAVDFGSLLVNMHFSREKEEQADRFAIEILNDLGQTTLGMAAFFDRLSVDQEAVESNMETDEEGFRVSQILDWISTHPPGEDRSKILRENGKFEKSQPPLLSEAEWAALKGICTETNPLPSP